MIQLTPKQKAKELVFRFYKIVGLSGFEYDCVLPIASLDNYYHKIAQRRAKECALESVKEISKGVALQTIVHPHLNNYKYYKEVLEEIKNL